MRPFDVFICYKKSSGKDFADHLKAGLEELGYHTFLDTKDLSRVVDGQEEWSKFRDQALKESYVFILLITPGFDLSQEVRNELALARHSARKNFIYFRHRDLGRKIVVDLVNEKVDLGKQEQVSFETKEELLRLAHGLLLKCEKTSQASPKPLYPVTPKPPDNANKEIEQQKPKELIQHTCAMCSRVIEDGKCLVESIGEKTYTFDSNECVKTFKKLKSVYGKNLP